MKRQERQSPETETAEGSKKTTKNASGAPNAEFEEMTDMLMRLEKSIERRKKEEADAAKKKEEERQKREMETIVTMVQVPENTLKVMEKIEKLNDDGWRRLKRFLATEETPDGAKPEGTKRRRACNQDDARETANMPKRMQRAIENRKKEAFEMITRIDTEVVKHALMNVGERFLVDNKEGTEKVQTFEIGKTRIHTGKFEDLMNLWEKRTTGDGREEEQDSDEEEKMDAEGSGEPHRAEECQMNMEVMDTHEEKKEENVRRPLRSTPIESRIDLRRLQEAFKVSNYVPEDLATYMRQVAENMGMTEEVLTELKGKVDLPIPGTVVQDFKFGTKKLKFPGP
ncbi:unnamed protein product, partial [Notodromas monacha]